jgi:hypothetical protein
MTTKAAAPTTPIKGMGGDGIENLRSATNPKKSRYWKPLIRRNETPITFQSAAAHLPVMMLQIVRTTRNINEIDKGINDMEVSLLSDY